MHRNAANGPTTRPPEGWREPPINGQIMPNIFMEKFKMRPTETALNYDRFGRPIKNDLSKTSRSRRPRSDSSEPSVSERIDQLLDRLPAIEHEFQLTDSKCSGWRTTLENNGPYGHMFTLAFKHPYSDIEAIAALAAWSGMFNREVYGPRWRKKTTGFSGASFAERHLLSVDFRGRLHFHTLLGQSDDLPDTNHLREVAYNKALLLTDSRNCPMTDRNRIDFRAVHDQERMIGYLLKNSHLNGWGTGEAIAFWKPGETIQGFQFKPRSARQLRSMH